MTPLDAANGRKGRIPARFLNPILPVAVELCPHCGRNPAAPPHPCPYRQDILNDGTTLCTCCPDCAQECANDI